MELNKVQWVRAPDHEVSHRLIVPVLRSSVILCRARLTNSVGCLRSRLESSANLEGALAAHTEERTPHNVVAVWDARAFSVDLSSAEVLRLAEDFASRTINRGSRVKMPIRF
jgi:hypothetical protein